MKVYLFGWPGLVGGAATKFTHLIGLLAPDFEVTVVPGFDSWERDTRWTGWIESRNASVCHPENLPRRLDAWGIALCHEAFLAGPWLPRLKRRGLKLAWGNEMMWVMQAESAALMLGWIDTLLYVSPQQRAVLEPEYRRLAAGSLQSGPVPDDLQRKSGWLRAGSHRLRWRQVGNYVDAEAFPFHDRFAGPAAPGLTVGRLSRADPLKFPEDFPEFYEGLGLPDARFRVMAWNEVLRQIWPDERFDARWELLPAGDPGSFLRSLDLFVYDVGPAFRESWGRSVAEAMLSGAVPLVPKGGGHHLEDLVEDGRSGFVCASRREFGARARQLAADPALRRRMSFAARSRALRTFSNRRAHLEIWRRVLAG